MVIKPEEKQKAIVLGLGLVGVLLYFVVFVIPKLGGPKADPAEAAAAEQAAATAAAAAAAQAAPVAGTTTTAAPIDLYADLEAPIPATSDPFSPLIPPAGEGPVVPIRQAPAMQSFAANNLSGKLGVAPVLPPSWPLIELQGVVPGEPAIAVLKVGDQTYHKHEGDRLDSGVVIARITEAGVILQLDKRNISLEIGHSTEPVKTFRNAVTPTAQAPLLTTTPVPGNSLPAVPGTAEMAAYAQPTEDSGFMSVQSTDGFVVRPAAFRSAAPVEKAKRKHIVRHYRRHGRYRNGRHYGSAHKRHRLISRKVHVR
jgi:hypothetical protein